VTLAVRKSGAACGAEIVCDLRGSSGGRRRRDLAICDYALPERRLMHRTTVIGGYCLSLKLDRCPTSFDCSLRSRSELAPAQAGDEDFS
jgi:hypothetical protein